MPIRRIVVAIDASPGSMAALEAAAELAGMFEAELHGLFVEDVDLLRWSSLPFAREVGSTSGEYRRVESGELERQLRAQAARVRATLDATARRLGVHTSFRITRGAVPEELLLHLTGDDVLSLGVRGRAGRPGHRLGSTARRVIAAGRGRTLLLPAGVRPRAPVAVVVDGTAASADALEIAGRLARRRARDVYLYCIAPTEQAARALFREAMTRFGNGATEAPFRHLEPRAVSRAGHLAHADGAHTLMLPSGTETISEEQLETIVAEFPGCLLITRAAAAAGE